MFNTLPVRWWFYNNAQYTLPARWWFYNNAQYTVPVRWWFYNNAQYIYAFVMMLDTVWHIFCYIEDAATAHPDDSELHFGTSCGISSGFLIAFIPQGESAYSEEWL